VHGNWKATFKTDLVASNWGSEASLLAAREVLVVEHSAEPESQSVLGK